MAAPVKLNVRRMAVPKLHCPSCGAPLPFSRLLFLTPWAKFPCQKCGVKLASRKILAFTTLPFGLLIGLPAMFFLHESSVSEASILFWVAILWLAFGFAAYLALVARIQLRVVQVKSSMRN